MRIFKLPYLWYNLCTSPLQFIALVMKNLIKKLLAIDFQRWPKCKLQQHCFIARNLIRTSLARLFRLDFRISFYDCLQSQWHTHDVILKHVLIHIQQNTHAILMTVVFTKKKSCMLSVLCENILMLLVRFLSFQLHIQTYMLCMWPWNFTYNESL